MQAHRRLGQIELPRGCREIPLRNHLGEGSHLVKVEAPHFQIFLKQYAFNFELFRKIELHSGAINAAITCDRAASRYQSKAYGIDMKSKFVLRQLDHHVRSEGRRTPQASARARANRRSTRR